MAKKPKSKKRKKAPGTGLSAQADRYQLYLDAVQSPDVDVSFLNATFKKRFKRQARVLREDFCGTAAVCCEWVRPKGPRQAIGVDLDPEPLEWGRRHLLARLPERSRERIQLLQLDVREVTGPKADIVAAQNFSFYTFKTRDELRGYFAAALENLADEGMLVLDMMGGSQSHEEDHIEKRKVGKVRYLWEQRRFDPITHHCENHIHFEFKDGSRLESAFVYDWRLWSLPEVQEVLLEAGFDQAEVYWEGTDEETEEGNGEFNPQTSAEADPAWIAYVVGWKFKAGR